MTPKEIRASIESIKQHDMARIKRSCELAAVGKLTPDCETCATKVARGNWSQFNACQRRHDWKYYTRPMCQPLVEDDGDITSSQEEY